MHEQQQADQCGERQVGCDHQAALGKTVDDEPSERRDHAGRAEAEEDDSRLGVRAGQDARSDAERDDHGPVAEHRQRLPSQEEADVAATEQRPHAARNTLKSPLTVLPRTTSIGPSPTAPASLPSGTSEARSPETEPASTSRFVPGATPTRMSPDTD